MTTRCPPAFFSNPSRKDSSRRHNEHCAYLAIGRRWPKPWIDLIGISTDLHPIACDILRYVARTSDSQHL
jgi:hypothetical protein